MPKIRKKTSKRGTTHQREKIKRKVSEAHKKAKKQAKKDPTWHSNKKEKDLGIPSKFPFKDQILAEAAELKARRDEERQLRREQQKAAHQAASLGLPDPAMAELANSANPYATLDMEDADDDGFETASNEDEDEDEGTSATLRLHARSLREVISKSDVIIQVLDARDPEGTRSRKMEREAVQVQGKKLVLVLNKIDLVPRENTEAWLANLRRSFPTLPFKSSTQAQRKNLSSSSKSSHVPTGASSSSPAPLLTLLKNYSRAGTLTVGVIGFPNVGKSSLINTLKRSKACGVAPTPGFTKEVQVVSLDGSLKILDCPGVVYEGGDQTPEGILRNCTAVEQVEDPIAPVDVILRKCKKEHLMMLYNVPFFADTKNFLISVARARGRLRKGGVPDIPGAARMILHDWNAGRIPYYTVPSTASSQKTVQAGSIAPFAGAAKASASLMKTTEDIGSAAIVSQLAPEFDLDSLFQEADSSALEGVKSSKEMAPGSVVKLNESIMSMNLGEGETESAGALRLIGETDDIEEEDGDEAPMLVPTPPSKSKKRSAVDAGAETVSLPPQLKKRVTFDNGTSAKSSVKSKLFADAPEEAPVQLNKAIKQQAKKDKKKKAKAAREAMDEDSAETVLSKAAATEQAFNPDKPQPYDFSKFFGAPQAAAHDEDVDM